METEAVIETRAVLRIPRGAAFVVRELALWASVYGAYLLLRSLVVADEATAVENGLRIVSAERQAGVLQEATVQEAVGRTDGLFGAYYMLGFAPVVAGTCILL